MTPALWTPARRVFVPGLVTPRRSASELLHECAIMPAVPSVPGNGASRLAGGKGAGGKGSGGQGSGGGGKGGTGKPIPNVPPTILSAVLNATGTKLTLTFDQSVTGVSAADFAISDRRGLSNAAGSGTTWTLDVSH